MILLLRYSVQGNVNETKDVIFAYNFLGYIWFSCLLLKSLICDGEGAGSRGNRGAGKPTKGI